MAVATFAMLATEMTRLSLFAPFHSKFFFMTVMTAMTAMTPFSFARIRTLSVIGVIGVMLSFGGTQNHPFHLYTVSKNDFLS